MTPVSCVCNTHTSPRFGRPRRRSAVPWVDGLSPVHARGFAPRQRFVYVPSSASSVSISKRGISFTQRANLLHAKRSGKHLWATQTAELVVHCRQCLRLCRWSPAARFRHRCIRGFLTTAIGTLVAPVCTLTASAKKQATRRQKGSDQRRGNSPRSCCVGV